MVWDPVLRVQVSIDLLNISFSSTFEIVGSKLIGRWIKRLLDFFLVWVSLLFVQPLMIWASIRVTVWR
jgi:lipopolysaccharide/colanic/teichoic acid biosynthesis glycosyltransferase